MPSDAKRDTDIGLNILMPRGRYRTASSELLKAGYLDLQNEALVKGNTLPIWKLDV
jgi:hypothetical protein